MHLAASFIRTYGRNRPLYGYLIRNAVFTPADETPCLTRQSDNYVDLLGTMIEEAKGAGLVRADVDTTLAAAGIFSLYLGALAGLFRVPDLAIESVLQGLRTTTGHYLGGISPRSQRTDRPPDWRSS